MDDAVKALPDHGPEARLTAVREDPSFALRIFSLVAEGQTLREIAEMWKLPPAAFAEWYLTVHEERYRAARVVRAEDLAEKAYREALKPESKDDVPAAKLASDASWRMASALDKPRYGNTVQVSGGGGVGVNAELVGLARDLFAHIGKRPGTIDAGTVTVEDAVVLPAPGEDDGKGAI